MPDMLGYVLVILGWSLLLGSLVAGVVSWALLRGARRQEGR